MSSEANKDSTTISTLPMEAEREGIGAAYIKGFRRAIESYQAKVVLEFDGDLQHPPEVIPQLLAKIDEGADYVLASRRIKRGSFPWGWGLKRLLFSRVGGFVARLLLFFPLKVFFPITDPTTGVKASRVDGLADELNHEGVSSKGFGYKLDLLNQMAKLGTRIAEIPLALRLRSAGESKMTRQTAREIFTTILTIRWHDEDIRRLPKFAIVGLLGFLMQ